MPAFKRALFGLLTGVWSLDPDSRKVYNLGFARSSMPKIKTNRTAAKKFSINKKGTIKRGGAHHSHKSFTKSAKRRRNLRKGKLVAATDASAVRRQLPYA
jgi:large subunit ribosomal protein L35